MAHQILIYFNINSLFHHGQHGFRAGHSRETALHEIISDVLANLDKNLINFLLFIDFKKAFDFVNSDLLMHKLFHYGFSTEAINLLRNYFTNRKQATKIDDFTSIMLLIILGVPQGSVLGPLLFLILLMT